MNLRNRIAKVLYGRIENPVPLFDSQPDEVKDAWLADADAVIAELQPELTRHDTGCACTVCWYNR